MPLVLPGWFPGPRTDHAGLSDWGLSSGRNELSLSTAISVAFVVIFPATTVIALYARYRGQVSSARTRR